MNTRRKFIINGSMAAASILAAKPFQAIAATGPLFQTSSGENFLILMHTTGLDEVKHQETIKFIAAVQNKTSNSLLIDSSNLSEEKYEVVNNGGIRTGIIRINKSSSLSANTISELASHLKKEKQCKIVACVSSVGYSHKDKPCDLQLAKESAGVDIFIGTNPDNYTKYPRVMHNSLKHEVILQSSCSDKSAFGKVEIGFDKHGNRNHIHILNNVPQKHQHQQRNAIVAA